MQVAPWGRIFVHLGEGLNNYAFVWAEVLCA